MNGGTGMRGLTDRLAALDGRLYVSSPPGRERCCERRSVRVVIADDAVLPRRRRPAAHRGRNRRGRPERGTQRPAPEGRAHKPDVAIIDVRMPPDNADDGLRAALVIREELLTWTFCCLAVRRGPLTSAAACRWGGGRRLPAQGSDRRGRAALRGGRASRAGDSVLDPRWCADARALARREPARCADGQGARGAGPDGRGPDEPGDRRRALHPASAQSSATSRASSANSSCRRPRRTTGGSWPF